MCYQKKASTIAVLCCGSIEAITFYEGHFYDAAKSFSVPEFSSTETRISGFDENRYGQLWFYFKPGYYIREEDYTNRLRSSTKEFTYSEKETNSQSYPWYSTCCDGEFPMSTH